ncbi:MAG: Rrf2 family transcriptional regulator [Aureispira sp.]|nr:Rrf2 family transcriptional regulator [Aureispira sp.]
MFSKACEYGIKATVYIHNQSQKGNRVNLKSVAKAIDSPVAFTAKILQSLTHNDIITSTKGATGGYEVLSHHSKTNLLELVKAIDGDKIYNGCALGFEHCSSDKPCPIHAEFKSVREDLKEMLLSTTIEGLARDLSKGKAFLKE